MRVTPLEVLEQTFRLCFRGFDPVEVDAFLQRVADELERLADERDKALAELQEARQARSSMEAALASARELQAGLAERAHQEAESVLARARAQADRLLAEAGEQLARLRAETAAVAERRLLLLAEVEALGQTVAAWAREHRETASSRWESGAEEDAGGEPEDGDAGPG